MRRLRILFSAILIVDTMFYAAITPLLPEYVERFGLSKTGAGILSGACATGTLLMALPSGWLSTRFGSRRTMLLGVGLLSASSLGFGFAQSIVLLDAMRFLQGVGGACSFAGGMGWLVSLTPTEQRGTAIGAAMSAALAGVLLGPVLGSVARVVGPKVPFTAVAVVGAVLTVIALRFDAAPTTVPVRQPLGGLARERRVRIGALLVLAAALVMGAIEVLAPLALDRLGASGIAIGATFLIAAGIEAVAQIFVGRASDRHGHGRPIRISLMGTIGFMLVFPLPGSAWVLAPIVVVGCVIAGAINTPAMTMLSDGIEAAGLDHGLGFALVNLVWAGGQVVGAIGGGALAGATSDAVVFVLLAAACTTVFAAYARSDRRPLVAIH